MGIIGSEDAKDAKDAKDSVHPISYKLLWIARISLTFIHQQTVDKATTSVLVGRFYTAPTMGQTDAWKVQPTRMVLYLCDSGLNLHILLSGHNYLSVLITNNNEQMSH